MIPRNTADKWEGRQGCAEETNPLSWLLIRFYKGEDLPHASENRPSLVRAAFVSNTPKGTVPQHCHSGKQMSRRVSKVTHCMRAVAGRTMPGPSSAHLHFTKR